MWSPENPEGSETCVPDRTGGLAPPVRATTNEMMAGRMVWGHGSRVTLLTFGDLGDLCDLW